jgi:transcriptional regulator with XRE-family HTH domain
MSPKRKPARMEGSPLIGVLKEAIQESGLSVNELAKQSGVSQPQLSRFMRGDRSLTLPAAEKLVEFFGMRLVKAGETRKGK